MSTTALNHLHLRHVDGVVVIDIMSKDIQGPDRAKEFIAELMSVAEEEIGKPILVNLRGALLQQHGVFGPVQAGEMRQGTATAGEVLQYAPRRARRGRHRRTSPRRRVL